MKAIEFNGAGGPEVITLVDREMPVPNTDEILIKVKAAGVNRPDVMQREGKYKPPEGVTDIPGLEVAGEVVQRGSNSFSFKEGDQVCAILPGGGYAEYAAVKAINVAPLPKGISLTEGGAMMETFMTVW